MTSTGTPKRSLQLTGTSWFNSPTCVWLVIAISAALFLLGTVQLVQEFQENPLFPASTDLSLYMRAADTVLAGGNPYDPAINTGFNIYGYPPLLADLLALMSAIIGATAINIVWPVLCAASLVAATVLIFRGFGFKVDWHWIMLVLGLLSISRLVRMDIYHGQVNFFMLLLVAGALILRGRGQIILAASCLAIAMSLKPFFGVLAIYFLLRRDWKMGGYSIAIGAAVFFLSFLPLYSNIIESFFGWRDASSQLISGASGARGDNQSFYGLFLRMFSRTPFSTPWLDNAMLVTVFTSIGVLISGSFAWFLFAGPRNGREGLAPERLVVGLLECCVVLALAHACGPYTEGDHIFFTIAGLAAAVMLGVERWEDRSPHIMLWVATSLAWSLSVAFIALPNSVWFTLGTPESYNDLSGALILLSGRNGMLLLLAGSMTAVTLGLERRSVRHGRTITSA